MEIGAERPATLVVCPTCKRLTTTETGYCTHCGSYLAPILLTEPDYKWDIYLGKSPDGSKRGILARDLMKHMVILGVVGSGKTSMVKRLLVETSRMGVNYTVLDWEGEYEDITGLTGGVVLGGRTPLKINLFNNKHVDPVVYSSMLFSIMLNIMKDNGWDVTPQMESLLRDSIENAVRLGSSPSRFLEILMAKSSEYPQGRHTAYALRSRLTPIFRGAVSRVFGGGDTLRPLMGRRLIIDLSWLSKVSPIEARFLSRLIIGLFYHEAVRTRGSSVLRHLLVVEEAEEVLSPAGCGEVGFLSPVSHMMHLRRKGVGMVIVAHSPRLLDPSVLRIPGNTAVFRVDNFEDAKYSAGMLGDADLASEIQSLNVGEVLVKPSSARGPFKLNIDRLSIHSDDGLIKLINSILRYPFLSQRDRRSLLGMSGKEYFKLVHRAVEGGFVEVVSVNTGSGRPVKLLQVKGSNPGAAHQFLLDKVKKLLDQEGYNYITLERRPDIVVLRESGNICVEIETGSNISLGKYIRFSEYCDSMITICSNRKCVSKVLSTVRKEPKLSSIIKVTLLSGFRRELKKILLRI